MTKIGDYLAAGKPMINTCSSRNSAPKVDADGFGVNIEAEDVKILADAIGKFANDPALCEKHGQKPDRSRRNSSTGRSPIRGFRGVDRGTYRKNKSST